MGFRISLYCISKEKAEKYSNYTEEDYDKDPDAFHDELTTEKIKYDTLTDVIMSDNEDKFSTRLFKNKLDIETDCYFATISKQQLLNIIEDVRVNHILKWFDGRRVDGDEELGEAWQEKEHRIYAPNVKTFDVKWTAELAMKANQFEWNDKAAKWKYQRKEKNGSTHYFNINIDEDNKWLVSGGDTYEYLIFDLIHILKIFDWENDVLLCIGG